MSAAKACCYVTGVLLLLLAVTAHAIDVANRESLVRRFLADDGEAMVGIIESYGLNSIDCRLQATNDLKALVAALLTTESLATPRFSDWGRRVIVHTARFTGAVPNISIGPGRIRLTTARAALQASDSRAAQALAVRSDTELAEELLDSCASAHVIVAILDSISREGYDRVDRKFIRKAATLYNGQVDAANRVEGKLSHEIYLQLVYDAYQYYRFLALTAK